MEKELNRFASKRESLICIGVFDGVHLGHAALICRAVGEARQSGLRCVALTFTEHPGSARSPHSESELLSGQSERARLIRQLGVDEVILLSFSQKLANLTAEAFASKLQQYLHMKVLVIGRGAALGRDREGTAEVLEQLGSTLGFEVRVVDLVERGGEVITSTTIRRALAAGDVHKAAAMLGRGYSLDGIVISGDRRGATLGFPTANILVDASRALPADGVYATRAFVGESSTPAVTFIGKRLTFGDQRRVIETHLLGYSGDLYGKSLRVEMVRRLRNVRIFLDPADLAAQIAADVEAAKAFFPPRTIWRNRVFRRAGLIPAPPSGGLAEEIF